MQLRPLAKLALLLLVAGCGGRGVADVAEPSVVTATTGAAPTTQVAAAQEPTSSVITPTTQVEDVIESQATGGAAATFDPDYYAAGAGRNFPSLDSPAYVPISTADWLDDDDIVMGVVRGETAVAFPVMQMVYHHIANADVAGEPYLVTY